MFKTECKTKDEEQRKLVEIKNSLKIIMRMMYTVYGKPVILLIDEYDVPLAKAQESRDKRYYRQMLDMIREIMSISLESNEFLKFAVITGCLRISRDSIFTGVNNVACYSVTARNYSRYFGFEPFEVQSMFDYFDLSDKYDIIKQRYDRYIFGNTEVFCPWDVVNYIASALDYNDEPPRDYWANISSNAILDDFVSHREIDASEKF